MEKIKSRPGLLGSTANYNGMGGSYKGSKKGHCRKAARREQAANTRGEATRGLTKTKKSRLFSLALSLYIKVCIRGSRLAIFPVAQV